MDTCEGCVALLNGAGCGEEKNNKDNSCPCTYCIVKVMCQSICLYWVEWANTFHIGGNYYGIL